MYKAARERSYVDPEKVREILGVAPEETTTDPDRDRIHEATGRWKIHLNVYNSSLVDTEIMSRISICRGTKFLVVFIQIGPVHSKFGTELC